jgi:hypothetical protein
MNVSIAFSIWLFDSYLVVSIALIRLENTSLQDKYLYFPSSSVEAVRFHDGVFCTVYGFVSTKLLSHGLKLASFDASFCSHLPPTHFKYFTLSSLILYSP